MIIISEFYTSVTSLYITWRNIFGIITSVPSKIFVSRPVSKKYHQDQKKLRRPW